MGEYITRTFYPEGENSYDKGEEKRRAATKANEQAATLKQGGEMGVASALATGAVRPPATAEEQNAGIVGKLQSIFTSPSGVLGKAKTARKKLLGN